MAYETLPLTKEQETIILANYEKTSIPDLIPMVWPEVEKPDGRSIHAHTIKVFLAGLGKKPLPFVKPTPQGPYILSEDQKRQIEGLVPKVRREGGALEVARIVIGDPTLSALHNAARAVFAYMKEVYPEAVTSVDEVVPADEIEWKPPNTMPGLVGLVNQFVNQHDTSKTYNLTTLRPVDRRCLEQLMIYMRVYRFSYVASQYDKQVDRNLFLSTFIRWCHTKPDLTDMEQDQMISAAEETVNIAQIGRSIQRIDKMHEEIAAGNVVDDNGKKVKLGMAEVELIGSVRTKYDAAKKRLEANMKALETARSDRLKGLQSKYTSILDLFEMWQKNEGFRDKALEAGIQEKEDDAREVGRLSGLEELIALISGQTKDEARA